jgi:uncharacterized protein
MATTQSGSFTCFLGHRRLTTGPLSAAGLVAKHAVEQGSEKPVLIFDDDTGRSIDIDTRGTDDEVIARLAQHSVESFSGEPLTMDEPRGRGRPKLGVVAREVTLLPRHWEWLAKQPGGASVSLRKLVEEARRSHVDQDNARYMQERAYHFMSAMAGDMPGFEEATRALFANDSTRFSALIATWPADVRDHAAWLAYGHGTQA